MRREHQRLQQVLAQSIRSSLFTYRHISIQEPRALLTAEEDSCIIHANARYLTWYSIGMSATSNCRKLRDLVPRDRFEVWRWWWQLAAAYESLYTCNVPSGDGQAIADVVSVVIYDHEDNLSSNSGSDEHCKRRPRYLQKLVLNPRPMPVGQPPMVLKTLAGAVVLTFTFVNDATSAAAVDPPKSTVEQQPSCPSENTPGSVDAMGRPQLRVSAGKMDYDAAMFEPAKMDVDQPDGVAAYLHFATPSPLAVSGIDPHTASAAWPPDLPWPT